MKEPVATPGGAAAGAGAAPARMANWVLAILRGTPSLAGVVGEERDIEADATPNSIEVRLVDRDRPDETLESARIADPSWFVPDEMPHARRLANRLAAELRRKWELR